MDKNGNIENGNWPFQTTEFIYSSPALADLNGNGDLEIVFGTGIFSGSQVFLLDYLGNSLEGWPKINDGMGSLSSPAIVDLDGDYTPEIIQANYYYPNAPIFGWNFDGTNVNGWPTEIFGGALSSSIVGDITGDGIPNIIVGSTENELYAWHSNGIIVEGFPKQVDEWIGATPALADLDYDGDVELIVASISNVYVYDLDAPYNPETMDWPMFQHDPQHTGCYDCVSMEIIPPQPTRPQSKIVNNEDIEIIGNLKMILQKSVGNIWTNVQVVVDKNIIIPANSLIKLDNEWNPQNVVASEGGNYRVYAALLDSNGNVINTIDGGKLETNWEFEVGAGGGGGGGGTG